MLEYELVDANEVCQKVRVEPATRSAVATCIYIYIYIQTLAQNRTAVKISDHAYRHTKFCVRALQEAGG